MSNFTIQLKATHDHQIKDHHHHPLHPVRLRVGSDVIHEEARTKQNSDLEHVEQERHRLVREPAEDDEERHPKDEELDAEVDRAPLGEGVRGGRRPQVPPEVLADEVDDGEDAVGRVGDEREEDEAEPSAKGG